VSEHRRRFLALVSAITIGAVPLTENLAYAKITIPLDPPVDESHADEIGKIEALIVAALKGKSEDQPVSLKDIVATDSKLQTLTETKINLAVVDLLWRGDIEEVGEGTFRIVRSGAG
jgi:hypothetical protein